MSFTVTKTVGATGRQYATVALAEAAIGTKNLNTSEQSAAGTFAVASYTFNETLTFSLSGATGVFIATDSTGPGTGTYIVYSITTGNPIIADVVTGGTSGATCILSSSTPMDTGVIWTMEMYNDAQFTEENTSILGMTVGSVGYIILKTAAGQSAFDTAANPLVYDQSKGVGWLGVTGYNNHITNGVDYTQMEGIQFKRTTSGSGVAAFNQGAFANQRIRRCLVDNVRAHSSFIMASGKVINSIVINRHATTALGMALSYGGGAINCGCVVPSSITANGTAYTKGGGAGSETLDNCYSFGFTNAVSAAFDGGNYNCTDVASGLPGANSQHALTYADQFVSTTADWKLKAGATLIAAGNTDATNAPNDIYGTVRGSGTAGDCGAHEFVAAAGGGGTLYGSGALIDGPLYSGRLAA